MQLPLTEILPTGDAIDAMKLPEAANFLLDGQIAAIDAVRKATREIEAASQIMAEVVRQGGTLIYAAAGSSGLMALADSCELTGTFGIPKDQIKIHMAGGIPVDGHMPGSTEDDAQSARNQAQMATSKDVVITLSASGSTPYAIDFANKSKAQGAKIIALANNPDTPLLHLADIGIYLETPPEVIAGSTRLGAATAQKAALNLMSTLTGVNLGHVYQGMMVNVIADNAKLIQRATRMISTIANISEPQARAFLTQAKGQVKNAILIAKGLSNEEANALLDKCNAQLGTCLAHLEETQNHPPKTSI